jgi:hypothetical protein
MCIKLPCSPYFPWLRLRSFVHSRQFYRTMACNGSMSYLIIGAGNFGAATALSLALSESL